MANTQQGLCSHKRQHLLASMLFMVAIIGILSACRPNTPHLPSAIPTSGPVTPTPDPGASMASPLFHQVEPCHLDKGCELTFAFSTRCVLPKPTSDLRDQGMCRMYRGIVLLQACP